MRQSEQDKAMLNFNCCAMPTHSCSHKKISFLRSSQNKKRPLSPGSVPPLRRNQISESSSLLVVMFVEPMLRRMMHSSVPFQKAKDIGRGKGLAPSYPKTGAENPEDAEFLIALNYEPIRDDLSQPCIAELKFISYRILVLLLRFEPEAATEYLNKRVIIINRSPYKQRSPDVTVDKVGYNELLILTDELMAEVFNQVLSKEIFPNLNTMVAFGQPACDYFLDLFPERTIQEEHCVHPEVIVKRQTTSKQRQTIIEILTSSLSMATGVEPSRQFTPLELDETIFASRVTPEERAAKAAKTRQRNRCILAVLRAHIRSNSDLEEGVVNSMTKDECADWIVAPLSEEAKATVEEKKVTVERKRLEAEKRLAEMTPSEAANAKRAKVKLADAASDRRDALIELKTNKQYAIDYMANNKERIITEAVSDIKKWSADEKNRIYSTHQLPGVVSAGKKWRVEIRFSRLAWKFGTFETLQTANYACHIARGIVGYGSSDMKVTILNVELAKMAIDVGLKALSQLPQQSPLQQSHTSPKTLFGDTDVRL